MQGQGCCICHIALLSRFCIEIKPVSTSDVFHLSSPVLHIAEDPFIDGNLLLAQKTRLQSYNGTHVIPVVGSEMPGYKEGNGAEAMFRRINSFTSKNRTHTIVVDQYNHCLRFVDLGASTTSRLVGQCNLAGSYYPHIQMADATSAIFDHPTSIVVKDNADIFQFYLADSMNNAIHIILMPDATSDSVLVTRIEASMAFNKPEHLLIHTDSDHLIVADHSGISRVQLGGSYPVENIINDKRLYAIEFSSNEPRSVLALSKSLDDVMLLDVDDGSTESLCHCSNQWSDVCSQINQPVAVFRQKRRLSSDTYEVYISQADGIVMGEYKNSLLNGSGCHPLPSHSSLLFPATFSYDLVKILIPICAAVVAVLCVVAVVIRKRGCTANEAGGTAVTEISMESMEGDIVYMRSRENYEPITDTTTKPRKRQKKKRHRNGVINGMTDQRNGGLKSIYQL